MKSGLVVLALLLVLRPAAAQTREGLPKQIYVVAAPFRQAPWGNRLTYVAGGGNVFLYKGLGAGAEIGPIITRSETGNRYVYGLGSANLTYYLPREFRRSGIEPFLTAGYSTTFRAGMQHGTNVGGGVNVWVEGLALRFEFRHYLGRVRVDYVGPRFGLEITGRTP